MGKGDPMPRPTPVELLPHDPAFALAAERETARLRAVLCDHLIAVHHVGSTAIPGIRAKPVLDLMPVVDKIGALDVRRVEIEALGYEWWGEYGLPGRRYCTLNDPDTGKRRVQLHCYEQGSDEIDRHLAFRDYLRAHPEVAGDYELEKTRCRALHPADSHAYNDCKSAWIKRTERLALAAHRALRAP